MKKLTAEERQIRLILEGIPQGMMATYYNSDWTLKDTPASRNHYELIGLGGYLRSGKDAVADHLEAHHGFKKLGMSDALHEDVSGWNPIVSHRIDWGQKTWTVEPIRYREATEQHGYVRAKEIYPEYRRALQAHGDATRKRDPDVWVKAAREKILVSRDANIPVVLTAVRFPNELEMMQLMGASLVWIDRGPEYFPAPDAHWSETALNRTHFDHEISNDGDLRALWGNVDDLMSDLKAE